MDTKYTPLDEMTFRQAMDELQGIVRSLESNTLELEDGLSAYKRGVELVADLQKRLSEAEQQVTMLKGELSGEQDDSVRDTTLS